MKDKFYDKLLHIKTGEGHELQSSPHYFRYEPTPYTALEQLFDSYKVGTDNRLVDFGCGKGRLNFFVHYLFQASVVGVEMNEDFYENTKENLASYMRRNRVINGQIQFYHGLAEDYRIHSTEDRFYFFNPFSVQIFMKVVHNILQSFERTQRELDIILYYPSDDYIFFLENETPFVLQTEIAVRDLAVHNPYERFSIYRLGV